jgi:protein-L-isoaspartate(D-aspartate) O-methyltransferase
MISSAAAIDAARDAMVDDLLQRRIIRTPAVERAFRRVRRHAFAVPPYAVAVDALAEEFIETDDPRRVYADVALGIRPEEHTNCLRPSIVAQQIEELAPAEGMRVLHVETGFGYATALLAELAGEHGSVVGTAYEEDLAKLSAAFLAREGYTTVTVRSGDGAAGVPEAAPFDRILVSAGAADLSPAWVDQLCDEGRLVLPLCHLGPLGPAISGGVILTIEKVDVALTGRIASAAVLMPLRGMLAPAREESIALAEGLQRWFALEDFYRTELPIRIVMKPLTQRSPDPAAVHWFLETHHTVMWVEPN